jgi:ribonuclease HI
VFVNFWLQWVKKEMKGKGYIMSAGNAPSPMGKEYSGYDRSKKVEVTGMKFIDDATWTTASEAALQEMIKMHETFCEFHKVMLHKGKSERFSINMKDPSTLSWTGSKGEGIRGPMDRWVTNEREGEKIPIPNREKAPMKYLGVMFDMNASWKTQKRITAKKLADLLSKIKTSTAALPMLIYAINTKIIPTIAYPLQVAAISVKTLEAWDQQIREALRIASGNHIVNSLHTEMYYRPVKDYGLGLFSIKKVVFRRRIKATMNIVNDTNLITGETSLVKRVVDAGAERSRRAHKAHYTKRSPGRPALIPNSLHTETLRAASHLSLTMVLAGEKEGANRPSMAKTFKKDIEVIEKIEYEPALDVYTDGSTHDNGTRAGWGFAAFTKAQDTSGKGKRRDSARLIGEQSNYLAEAIALLEVLRSTNPWTTLDIYIDNEGVVQEWEKDKRERTKERMQTPGRAIWNRITNLREYRSGITRVHWVHSHPDGKVNKTSRECACGAAPPEVCDENHRHHRGNDAADDEANKGANKERESRGEGHPSIGEEELILIWAAEEVKEIKVTNMNREEVRLAQGDIDTFIKMAEEEQEKRVEYEMGSSKRVVAEALRLS